MNSLAANTILPPSPLEFQSAIHTGENGFLKVPHGSTSSPLPPRSGPGIYRNDFFLGCDAPWQPARRDSAADFADFRHPALEVEWDELETGRLSTEYELIQGEISSGRWRKAVPILTETGRITSGDLSEFARFNPATDRGRFFYFEDGDSGMAGVTPERLLRIEGRRLETAALAGTARLDDAASLKSSEKERDEHECVADFIAEALQPFGRVERGEVILKPVGGLAHLMTPFVVELDEDFDLAGGINDLIRVLHPTPAVGIAPRTDASLRELGEMRKRLRTPADFAAPFGFIEDGLCEIHVAIRCILWEGGRVFLPSGVGIVGGSRLEHEIRELRLKREAVKEMLGLR